MRPPGHFLPIDAASHVMAKLAHVSAIPGFSRASPAFAAATQKFDARGTPGP